MAIWSDLWQLPVAKRRQAIDDARGFVVPTFSPPENPQASRRERTQQAKRTRESKVNPLEVARDEAKRNRKKVLS